MTSWPEIAGYIGPKVSLELGGDIGAAWLHQSLE